MITIKNIRKLKEGDIFFYVGYDELMKVRIIAENDDTWKNPNIHCVGECTFLFNRWLNLIGHKRQMKFTLGIIEKDCFLDFEKARKCLLTKLQQEEVKMLASVSELRDSLKELTDLKYQPKVKKSKA